MRLPGHPSRAAFTLLVCALSLPVLMFSVMRASAQPGYAPGPEPGYGYGAAPPYQQAPPGYDGGVEPDYGYGAPPDYAEPPGYDAGAQPAYDPGVGFEYFQARLAPFGAWQIHPRWGEVWRPHAGPEFRPYFRGTWQLTSDVGWLWVSDDPWGEITDHYGRWVFDPDGGWLWVPGYVWAPSWVIWREGDGYLGWFPMPPGYDEFEPVYAGGGFRDPERWYGYRDWYPTLADTSFFSMWVFVGAQDFGGPGRHYITDPYRARQFFGRTHDRTRYVRFRDRVIDRSIDVDWLRRTTRRQFAVHPSQHYLRGARITTITQGRDLARRARAGFGARQSAYRSGRLPGVTGRGAFGARELGQGPQFNGGRALDRRRFQPDGAQPPIAGQSNRAPFGGRNPAFIEQRERDAAQVEQRNREALEQRRAAQLQQRQREGAEAAQMQQRSREELEQRRRAMFEQRQREAAQGAQVQQRSREELEQRRRAMAEQRQRDAAQAMQQRNREEFEQRRRAMFEQRQRDAAQGAQVQQRNREEFEQRRRAMFERRAQPHQPMQGAGSPQAAAAERRARPVPAFGSRRDVNGGEQSAPQAQRQQRARGQGRPDHPRFRGGGGGPNRAAE